MNTIKVTQNSHVKAFRIQISLPLINMYVHNQLYIPDSLKIDVLK